MVAGNLTEEEAAKKFERIPLTDRQAAFLRTKGLAFRQLWGKRLALGMSADDEARFNERYVGCN